MYDRCVFVGDTRVGKTTLIRRLAGTPGPLLAKTEIRVQSYFGFPVSFVEVDGNVDVR